VAATWTYLVADLRTNIIVAELPLSKVTIAKKLGDAGSMSAQLPTSKVLSGDPYVLTTPGRTAMYALRDGVPWWGGVLWTRRYDSSTGIVDLAGSDWWSYFDHRKVLPILGASPGINTVAPLTVTYTGVDQNQIARNLVTLAQSHTGGDIGIQLDTSLSVTPRDRTYRGYELGDVGQRLRELAQVDGGPDIMFDVSGTDTSGRPIRILRLGDPWLGQQGSPHVFELGGNLLSYQWPSDGTRMATRAFATGDGIAEGALIAVAENTPRYADGWPLLEAEKGYTSVTDAGTLFDHARADQYAARLPVALPTISVRGDAGGPRIGDYSPGDDARVVFPAGDPFLRNGLDTVMRIVGISVSPGDAVEVATLTMSPMLEDAF
jgi:hypothetical protein